MPWAAATGDNTLPVQLHLPVLAFVSQETAKARYPYRFVHIDELERRSYDEAQARQPQIADTSGTVATRELIEKYNQ